MWSFCCNLLFPSFQIVVHKDSPRGTHFRRAGPRQKVHFFCALCIIQSDETDTAYIFTRYFLDISQVYFESDEVHACIVTCGGLCPGLNTVIREIVCGLYHMYGVKRVLGIGVSNLTWPYATLPMASFWQVKWICREDTGAFILEIQLLWHLNL